MYLWYIHSGGYIHIVVYTVRVDVSKIQVGFLFVFNLRKSDSLISSSILTFLPGEMNRIKLTNLCFVMF